MTSRARCVSYVCFLYLSLVLAQNPIRLDDTDKYTGSNPGGIQFSDSNWTDYSPIHTNARYNGSYSASNKAGANIILFFRGKSAYSVFNRSVTHHATGQSIVYYGDEDPAGGIATVRIDGQQYTNVSVGASLFSAQQALWTSPALDSGDHQVVISNLGARLNPKKPIVGLDFFEIVPNDASGDVAPLELGPGASSVPENAILVDNTDPTIAYGGNGWQPKPSTPDSTIYLGGSAYSTRFPAESCTFRFSGTAVWYFTDYSMGNAVVVISVDGGPVEAVNTTAPSQALSRSQRMSWSKTGLSDGPHTVMITHADWAGTWATVDFFKYLPGSNITTSSATSRPATSSESTSSSSATAAASTNFGTSNSGFNPALGGAIAGGVIGGVVGLTLLALVILALIRTRRKQNLQGSRARLTGEPSWNSLPASGRSAVGHGSSEAHAPSYPDGHVSLFLIFIITRV
ncbi:hypothetical protein FRC10_010380 [Ceratobasidium sp. 414]|nr:hypothetical protein FRC10_010380 [Ceratobasidium sp. 414]